MRLLVPAASVGFCIAATPAFGHAFLQASIPAVGSVVPSAPPELRLTYTEKIEPDFSKITVRNSGDADVTAGTMHAVDTATLAVPLKKLTAGTYSVTWHVTSVDTHKTQGNFTFTVAP